MFFKDSLLFKGKLTSIPGHPYSALKGALRVALEPTLDYHTLTYIKFSA